MIGTRFYEGQGLGNQLWVYATARSIAEYHQTKFRVLDSHLFKGASFLDIDTDVNTSAGQSSATGENISKAHLHKEQLFYDEDLKYFACAYDQRVEHIKSDTILEGLFQSEQYFYSGIDKLQKWIRLKESYLTDSLKHSKQCVINIRGGEYKRHHALILPKSYWEGAIRNIKLRYGVQDFLIVTDDPLYASRLLPGYAILEGSVADCYAALHGAGYLIVSNSSFSYFPIKTRKDKPPVIAPFLWSRPSNKQLRWASPANFYEGWIWQSAEGEIVDNATCKKIANETLEYYTSEYNIHASMQTIQKVPALSRLIPKVARLQAKRFLGRLFPMQIG
jgi:hypothetical protein